VIGKRNDAASSAKVLAASTEKAMEILESAEEQKETVSYEGLMPSLSVHPDQSGPGSVAALTSARSWKVCRMHGLGAVRPRADGTKIAHTVHGPRTQSRLKFAL